MIVFKIFLVPRFWHFEWYSYMSLFICFFNLLSPLGTHLACCSSWKKKSQICSYISIQGLWLMAWMDGQGFGKKLVGKSISWKFGNEVMWIDLDEWKIFWIFFSHICDLTHEVIIKGDLNRGGFWESSE